MDTGHKERELKLSSEWQMIVEDEQNSILLRCSAQAMGATSVPLCICGCSSSPSPHQLRPPAHTHYSARPHLRDLIHVLQQLLRQRAGGEAGPLPPARGGGGGGGAARVGVRHNLPRGRGERRQQGGFRYRPWRTKVSVHLCGTSTKMMNSSCPHTQQPPLQAPNARYLLHRWRRLMHHPTCPRPTLPAPRKRLTTWAGGASPPQANPRRHKLAHAATS